MTCRRCGKNNIPNAKHCYYCGASLINSNEQGKKRKNTEGIIVALIMVLVLILVVVAGVYIYKNNTSKGDGFGHGGGGSYIPHIPTQQETQMPIEETEEAEIEEPEDEESDYTPTPRVKNEKLEAKNTFLARADEIEIYSRNYLETAETQMEINNESGIVFEKWDKLLNDVYKYLKTIMSTSEFKQLQAEEERWIVEKEKAIAESGAEWSDGSGETMARNLTAIQYTEERCYYLISLIN